MFRGSAQLGSPLCWLQAGLCAAGVLAAVVLARIDVRFVRYDALPSFVTLIPAKATSFTTRPDAKDYVADLPQAPDPQATIRATTRIAENLRVTILQIQSKPVSTSPRAFGRVQYDLRLHGDYADVKSTLAGVLAKFAGLSLQRLSLHRANLHGVATDDDVDAEVELLQLLAPPSVQ